MIETEPFPADTTLDLVEFRQVSRIQCFISEDSVNWEKFHRPEPFLGHFIEHTGTDGRGMCSEDVGLGFVEGPVVSPTDRLVVTLLMHLLDSLPVLWQFDFWLFWFWQKESIVGVSGRVLLGLEKCVKIPERGLNEFIGRHLLEAHLQ